MHTAELALGALDDAFQITWPSGSGDVISKLTYDLSSPVDLTGFGGHDRLTVLLQSNTATIEMSAFAEDVNGFRWDHDLTVTGVGWKQFPFSTGWNVDFTRIVSAGSQRHHHAIGHLLPTLRGVPAQRIRSPDTAGINTSRAWRAHPGAQVGRSPWFGKVECYPWGAPSPRTAMSLFPPMAS